MFPLSLGYPREVIRISLLLIIGLITACSSAVDDAEVPTEPEQGSGNGQTYSIGGSVTRVAGTGLILQNNNQDNLLITADGNFTFSTPILDGNDYAVTVFQQPTLANAFVQCDVSSGADTLAGAVITNVSITCTITYAVSVTVSGYSTGNTMLLRNNGADDLLLTSDGFYTFSTGLADSIPYAVTLVTPATLLKTSCTLTNGAGTITSVGVTDVAVACTDDIAPEVATTNPIDGAIDVDTGIVINAVFDEDMLATSITPGAITLVDTFANSPVVGVTNYDVLNRTLSITPELPLALLRPYTATLSVGITDLSGQLLVSSPWSFLVRDGIWGTAQLIETNNLGVANEPQIALDSAGNGLAVWWQFDGVVYNIWANRFDSDTNTWGNAELIETEDLGDARTPQIAMDPAGNGMAVWRQNDGTRFNILSNRYNAVTNSWGTAQLIDDDPGGGTTPQIALDPAGNGIAVWLQAAEFNGVWFNSIWANRYDASTNTWGVAQLIESANPGSAANPQIALDLAGNGIAVWSQWQQVPIENAAYNIWANRFDSSSVTWGTPLKIETNDIEWGLYPQIALNHAGNGIAVWGQGSNVVANHFDASTNTWATAQIVGSNPKFSYSQIAIDPLGNGIVVWYQFDGIRDNIWTNRFDVGTNAWATAQMIDIEDLGDAGRPKIVLDKAGNGMAVWSQSDGTRANAWANRYDAGTNSWGTAQIIVMSASVSQIALDPAGNGMAVGIQSDGVRNNIWANHFK